MRIRWYVCAAVAAAVLMFAAVAVAPAFATTSTTVLFGDFNNSSYTASPPPIAANSLSGIGAAGANLGISLGDMTNAGDSTQLTDYLNLEGTYLSGLTIYRCIGDNENFESSTCRDTYNTDCSSQPDFTWGGVDNYRQYFSVDANGIHWVFLSNGEYKEWGMVPSNPPIHQGHLGFYGVNAANNSIQGNWLANDLANVSQPAMIVVVMHAPIINGKSDAKYLTSETAEAAALESLFADYGVDAVVSGDTHCYRQDWLTVNDGTNDYTVPYIQLPPSSSRVRYVGESDGHGTTLSLRNPGSEVFWECDNPGFDTTNGTRGFGTLIHDTVADTLQFKLWKVNANTGTVTQQTTGWDVTANASTGSVGWTVGNVPVNCSVGEAPPADEDVLLSQGCTCTASSYQTANPPSHAVDGSFNDVSGRWAASNGTFPQWLKVDLGAARTVNTVVVSTYLGRDYQYTVNESTDDSTYVAWTAGDNARYVKITITGVTGNVGWASLREVQVYGRTGGTQHLVGTNYCPNPRFHNNVADGWTISSGGHVTRTRDTAPGVSLPTGADAAIKFTHADTTTGYLYMPNTTAASAMAVDPGDTVYVNFQFYCPNFNGGKLKVIYDYYDASGSRFSSSAKLTLQTANAGFEVKSCSAVVPASAVGFRLSIDEETATFDAWITQVYVGLADHTYFDGDSTGGVWTGSSHNSYSQLWSN